MEVENPGLMKDFRFCLGTEDRAGGQHSLDVATSHLSQRALTKIDEITDAKGALDEESVIIRKAFDQTTKFIADGQDKLLKVTCRTNHCGKESYLW